MSTWKIGDVNVSRIVESEAPWPGTWLLPDATPENIKKEASWLFPTFSDEKGKLRMAIHALVLRHAFPARAFEGLIGPWRTALLPSEPVRAGVREDRRPRR